MYEIIQQTVLSQYANSPALSAIIADMNLWMDPAANLQNFYYQWWDIETATGYGLDNWGKILGISRYIQLPNIGAYVGFYNTENDYEPMSQAPFYGGGSTSSAYALTDSAYRTLLLAKALANISRTSIQALNVLAQAVFGPGAMFVVDLTGMAMLYVFSTTPTAVQLAIATNGNVLPHPTGVGTTVRTALLNNAKLVAGNSGTEYGFVASSFGTLTPSTDLNGHAINSAYYNSSGTHFVIQIASASSLTVSYFQYAIIGGAVLSTSALGGGSFAFSGGVNTWTWNNGVTIPVIANGSTYGLLIT